MSPLLEIRNLGVHYVTARGARVNRAVDVDHRAPAEVAREFLDGALPRRD